MEGKISQSENPQAAADKASQIIGVSALQRAQRKINAASSKQDIIVAIKTFALVLAVAGLVASCLATAGIAPFALGVSLAVAGVAIAITSGVLNKSVATDKTRAKSSQQVAESEIGSFNFMRDLQSASGVSDESVQSVKDQMLDAYDIGEYDIIEDICSEYVKKHQSGDKDDKKAVKEIQDYRNELINDLSDRSSFRPD